MVEDDISKCYEGLLDIKGIFPNWCNTQNNFYYHWKKVLYSSIEDNKDVVNLYLNILSPLINSKGEGIESTVALELIRKLDEYRKTTDDQFQVYNLEQLLNKDTSTIKVPQKEVKTRPATKVVPKKTKTIEEVNNVIGHVYGTRNRSKASLDDNDRVSAIGKHLKKGFFSDYVWDFMLSGTDVS